MIDHHEYEWLARDYTRQITGPSEEATLLAAVPWFLGWACRPLHLLQCLKSEAARFAELPGQLTFSLIATLRNTPPRLLNEFILSVRLQSWSHWELILVDDGSESTGHLPLARDWTRRDGRIRLLEWEESRGPGEAKNAALEMAGGDFVCLVEDTSLLHPSALGILARHLISARDINLIFSHEAQVNMAADRIGGFVYKPPFDLFTLLRTNYVGHLTAIERGLLHAAARGGPVLRPEHNGLEDHDLMIRIALCGQARTKSVPLFLYYRRVGIRRQVHGLDPGPAGNERRRALLHEVLPRVYPGSRWQLLPPSRRAGNAFHGIHLQAVDGRPRPSLLAIVPFKDNVQFTLKCLDSIERQQHELSVQVILVNNGSVEAGTADTLQSWLARSRRNTYTLVDDNGAFNFGRIHNRVVREHGRGRDLVLFLNNDVELISHDCLQTMAMQLCADEACGFVGIRLIYPDDHEVQHGGIKVAEDQIYICGYNRIDHATGREDFVDDERIVLGVTFACAMTRCDTFDALGGFEEVLIPNAYGDVDLCARAMEAGLRNYYFGTLVGIHHESKTRGRAVEDAEFVALHERHERLFARWRLRSLAFSPVPIPSSAAHCALPLHDSPGLAARGPLSSEHTELPLRYRVADRINEGIKILMGPVHGPLKRGFLGTWGLVRKLRSGRLHPAHDPPTRGPRSTARPARSRGEMSSSSR